MKILITGANGFLGRGIVKSLSCYDVNIVANAKLFKNKLDKIIYKECDLFSIEKPYEYFEKPDAVLHLAWSDGFVHMSDSHINNLPSHVMFIKKMAESGVKKICVLGSMHEIGFYEGSIDENTACNPQSFYGISKNALRNATQLICKNNNVIFQWIRGFYIVGNDSCGSSIFSKISKCALEGKKEFPFTMGLNQFDFLDYDIFCEYVTKIILQDKINGIINCCSGRPEKLSDRVERFIKDNNYNITLKYGAFPDRPYDSKAVWGNNAKLTKIIGEK